MYTYPIPRKANRRLSCTLKNAGIAVLVPMIAPEPGRSNLNGRFCIAGTGKIRLQGKSINYEPVAYEDKTGIEAISRNPNSAISVRWA